MKFVAVTRILDEADIVEAFVRHTAHFVSHHIFMDNGSNDGTIDILKSLAGEGFKITVFQNKSVHYNEREFNTFLYKEAVDRHAADWVVFLDADEFIDDSKLELSFVDYFNKLSTLHNPIHCVKIPMVNYQYTRQDNQSEIITPLRVTKRLAPLNSHKVIVSSKIRKNNIMIDNGSHRVLCNGYDVPEEIVEQNLWLAHFSERSPYQIVVKFVRGWAKILAAGDDVVKSGASDHYRGPYYIIKDRPHELLQNEWFMTRKNESPDLIEDPAKYRGGPLKYTQGAQEAMIAVRSLMGYVTDLATQHGRLIDSDPSVRKMVEQWGSNHNQII
ncbi:glycosyltransferase family 2 protein [Methylobacterium indicum]|uniref:glycosyltransferase family 2 protein n=1 Tax=Methylobacterium indicum TaxID=1775910 RepID=UPI0009E639D1|nr:glycosyltransferase family 2 protein [Methylobacterium indicum]